ncbi:hypothetical protein GRJ2_000548300 [Grus japonensis]|uniref:Uncharacterized protein n=1 Tax=Grus japonensis TaxID=30415 RepID=A0ABC9W634_GRUJA
MPYLVSAVRVAGGVKNSACLQSEQVSMARGGPAGNPRRELEAFAKGGCEFHAISEREHQSAPPISVASQKPGQTRYQGLHQENKIFMFATLILQAEEEMTYRAIFVLLASVELYFSRI